MLLSIEAHSGGFASDGCWVALFNINELEIIIIYNIFQDSIVDSGKSSASRSLLGSVSLGYRQKVKQSVTDDFKVRKDERKKAHSYLS